MSKTVRLVSIFLSLMLGISACNLPSNADVTPTAGADAILTAAAQTVEANLTQAAILNPPTVPVIPTSTTAPPTVTLAVSTNTQPVATNTPICDQAQFIKDVSIPDGTEFDPNETFTKTWQLKNVGTCTWSGYSLVFDSGDAMGGPASTPIGSVAPGQDVNLSVNLKAPGSTGSYRGYWRIKNSAGVLIPVLSGYQNTSFFVDIKVSSGPFAVTGVNTTVNPANYSGPCTDAGGKRIDFQFSADITTNGAGTVTYKWERSDNANAPEQSLTFASAGTKTVTTSWSRWFNPGDNDTGWERINITDPNHQTFAAANFTVTCDP